MKLYEKIFALYPDITEAEFGQFGTIRLQNDSDGKGDYIAEWNHPTYARPTDEQLAQVTA